MGAWRSEIKGEPTVIDRRGGHSRSYAPVPRRLVHVRVKSPVSERIWVQASYDKSAPYTAFATARLAKSSRCSR